MSEFVYFVQAGPSGPVKIGKAKDVEKRIAILQIGCPHRLETLGVIESPRARAREAELHRRFSSLRIDQSEWFHWSTTIADFITAETKPFVSQRDSDVSHVAARLGLNTITLPPATMESFRDQASKGQDCTWTILYRWLSDHHNAGSTDKLHNRTRVGEVTMRALLDVEAVWIQRAFRIKYGRKPKPREVREALTWLNMGGGPMTTDPDTGRHLVGEGLFVLPDEGRYSSTAEPIR